MEGLIVILVLVALGIAGFAWFQRARSSPLGQRAETYWRSEHPDDPQAAAPAAREPTVETLRPGDAVSFWDGEDSIVDTVLQCEEQLGGRRTQWRWNLLRGGRMLETAPDGNVLYTSSEVLYQGSAPFEQLTGDPSVGGVLKTFEARVRAGTAGSNPVFYEHQGKQFQVRSTGTFSARPIGSPPAGEVWRDLSDDPSQNVYFELDAPDGTQGLGVWTTHILLLIGEPLKTTDIRAIYPGQGASV
ncbi:MAG TPA: hypothetical protein VK066_15775 [Chloroflexota bacterium]|nr:hypothetical protein [Chloroflexota bacterium]